MKNEIKKLTTKQLIELIKTFEHYPAVTLKDGKDYILSYLEDEACTISKKEIAEYLLNNNVKITKENIHLYYEFMSDEDIIKYGGLLLNTIRERTNELVPHFDNQVLHYGVKSIDCKKLSLDLPRSAVYRLKIEVHGVKDTLKPIDEYITQIKDSDAYKEYRFDNLVKTYDLSISHLKQLERELFADDSTYISNIDNLIYSALDKIADDFKLNVIDYIEDNYLQESTGLTCISDIEVIIKDGEYQGIFKEFESYGLNDFSVQNITMFIDRYKELKESVEYKSYIVNDKSDFESDEYENICFENKMMGQFLEKLGLTPDEITSYVINGSEEDINKMITRVKGL